MGEIQDGSGEILALAVDGIREARVIDKNQIAVVSNKSKLIGSVCIE
jgi:hypothetical protein